MIRALSRLCAGFLLAGLFTGCATKLYIPGNRFMSPEASGELLKGDFKVGGVGVTHVEVADDITSASPNTTPLLLKNSSMELGLQLGLASRLDAYYNIVFGAPSAVGLKLQLIGDTAQNSKKGNFSLAIAGGAFIGNLKTTATVGSDTGNSDVNFGGYEALIPIGYRANDGFLVYVTPFQSHVTAAVDIKRTSGGVTTTTAQPNGFGVMRGVTLGLRLGGGFFLALEASGTETTWTREQPSTLESTKFSDTAIGAAIGGQW
ncbi:MAG: hypothetical protein AAB250_13890 [Bdellovibrionota bacterium]